MFALLKKKKKIEKRTETLISKIIFDQEKKNCSVHAKNFFLKLEFSSQD